MPRSSSSALPWLRYLQCAVAAFRQRALAALAFPTACMYEPSPRPVSSPLRPEVFTRTETSKFQALVAERRRSKNASALLNRASHLVLEPGKSEEQSQTCKYKSMPAFMHICIWSNYTRPQLHQPEWRCEHYGLLPCCAGNSLPTINYEVPYLMYEILGTTPLSKTRKPRRPQHILSVFQAVKSPKIS